MRTKRSFLKSIALLTGVVIAVTALIILANNLNSKFLKTSSTESGNELRSEFVEINKGSRELSKTVKNVTTSSELKCGEGKCGEENSNEDKCGKENSSEDKCGEGKCGEGKCGEAKSEDEKKDSKKEAASESKSEESSAEDK